MTAPMLGDLLETCRALVGYAWGAGRRAATAVAARFGSGQPAGRADLDIGAFQLALADEIEAMRRRLQVWEIRYEREVERGRALREEREEGVLAVRGRLRRIRNGLTGAFDHRAAARLVQPVKRLGAAPTALQEQAERLHAGLTDPALELSSPRPGVEIDLVQVADSLARPTARLRHTLAALAKSEAARSHAKARRDAERTRLTAFAGQMAAFQRALHALAGHGGNARRTSTPAAVAPSG